MDFVSRYARQGLGLLRIATALLFLQHGLVKLFGFPPDAAPGPQPLLSLLGVAGVIETVTGLLLVLGLFARPAAFVAAGFSAVAYFYAHAAQSFYPIVNQGELAALYCFVFLYIFFAGPGAFSLDGRRSRNGIG